MTTLIIFRNAHRHRAHNHIDTFACDCHVAYRHQFGVPIACNSLRIEINTFFFRKLRYCMGKWDSFLFLLGNLFAFETQK